MTKFERAASERHRLDELSALRRPLTDGEADEVLELARRERGREANRRWRERNPGHVAALSREWRQREARA